MCRTRKTKPFWNAAVDHWSVSSISTPAFYQLKCAKTHMQLSDIKQSTLKGEENFTDSQVFNLVLNGCSTLKWHSVNAIKMDLFVRGKKIFSTPLFLLSNRKKKTPSIPQTYIIKAQTEINLHEKISENFKNIALRTLRSLKTYQDLQWTSYFYGLSLKWCSTTHQGGQGWTSVQRIKRRLIPVTGSTRIIFYSVTFYYLQNNSRSHYGFSHGFSLWGVWCRGASFSLNSSWQFKQDGCDPS